MRVNGNRSDSRVSSIPSTLSQRRAQRWAALSKARTLLSLLVVWTLVCQTMVTPQRRLAYSRSHQEHRRQHSEAASSDARTHVNDGDWLTRLAKGWATSAVSSEAFSLLSILEPVVTPVATTGIALVRHAPLINGNSRVEGSLRQLTSESVTLNSGAVITADLQVPGTPTLLLNGNPTFGGTIQGTGSPQPTNFQVTLNGGTTVLGHLVNRTDPIPLASVPAPPASQGTRSVTITAAGQSGGNFATLRDLTLNGNVGMFTVPPGTYRNFIANAGSGFVFGISGANQPSTYNLSSLTLNSLSQLQIAGPVKLTLGNGLILNASMGSASHPAWLNLQVATGGLTLNAGSSLYSVVKAPAGPVVINANAQLVGTLACDRLTINAGGLLHLTESALPPMPPINQPPVVSAGANQTITLPDSATLNGSVTDDGLPQASAVTASWTKVSGAGNVNFANANNAVTTATFSQPGPYVLRLTASDSQLSSSDDVTISVAESHQPPVADFHVAEPTGGADNIISFLGETNSALSQSPVLVANGGAIYNFSYGGGSKADPVLGYFRGGWITNGTANQFATIQLAGGNVYTLDGVKLAIGSDFQFGDSTSVKDFEVWVSATTPEESSFTKVLSATAALDRRLQTFNFPGGPVSARYLKYVPLNNRGGGPNINTAMLDVIAAGRAKVVGYSGQNESETNPPEAAFDGDLKSNWFSPIGVNTDVWVKTSLANETTHKMYGVRINPVNDNSSFPFGPRDFEIRVSTTTANDNAFTTIFAGTLQKTNGPQEFLFDSLINAKYVEFFWKNSHSSSSIGVKELEVLAVPERGSTLVGYSSSSDPSSQGPTNALDIDPTGWPWLTASGQNTDQWLKLLLPNAEPWTIDHVALLPGGLFSDSGTAAKDFEIQVSTTDAADTSFSAIYSGTLQNTVNLQHFYFQPVQARYVRLLLKNNYGSARIGLHVFHIYTPDGGSTSARFEDRSTDADGRIVSWSWNFGDGVTSSDQNPTHEYAAPGSYIVTLTVTDDSGLTASHQLLYRAVGPPLTADFAISPLVAHEGEEKIRFIDTTRLLVKATSLRQWDFDDGSGPASFYEPTTSHTFLDSGTYAVTMRLGADNGVNSAFSRQVSVLNMAPAVDLDPGHTVVWGELWTSVPRISDPSPIDSQSLRGVWDFGDGQSSLCLNCNNASGTVAHAYDLPGVYNATLLVTDKDGGVGSTTATYTVNKRPTLLTFVAAESEGDEARFLLRVRVVDAFANLPLTGKQVSFNLDGASANAVTGTDGIAEARLPFSRGARIGLATAAISEDDLYLDNATAYTPPPSPDVHPAGTRSSKGTDFWLMFPQNYFDLGGIYDVSVNITSETDTTGVVTLARGSFPFTVGVHGVARVTLGTQDTVFVSDQVENKGIHVTSQNPVTVYGVNSRSLTGDAYLGLPTNVLGTDHIILGYANGDNLQGSEFGIVAATDATTVTITPAVTTLTRAAGVPYWITLNQGQTYMLSNESSGKANDLSGSIVSSNKSIAVFGGHLAASIPDGVAFADHLVEQLPATDTWGKHFVTMPFATRSSGDTFRFLAAADNTSIYLNGSRLTTLNRAQFYETIIKQPTYVISDKPILVAQYSHGTVRVEPRGLFDNSVGDPSMMLVPPFEQFLESYTVINFNLDGVSNQHINVVAPTTAIGNITLDGAPIPALNFAPIGSSAFSGAQLETSIGIHNLSGSQPFGVSVYGFGRDFGYAYPGGMNLVSAVNGVPNQPPAVNAGADQTITQPAVVNLQGSAIDDGLPANPLTSSWARVNGPGVVTFGDPNALVTTAKFDGTGVYVLRLTASDPNFTASDDVQITVNPAPINQPPIANAGPDGVVTLHANLIVNGGNELAPLNGEIPGWTEVQGISWMQGSVNSGTGFPIAQRGIAYFCAGDAQQAELRQDIDISAFAGNIAAGTQQFEFQAYVRSLPEAVPDAGRVILEYRNPTNTSVIATLDSGPITSTTNWHLTDDTRAVPPGTGWISVRLLATRNSGITNDAFFDSVSLRPIGNAAVKLEGSATDDGLPSGSNLSTTWAKVKGAGDVTFANPNAAATGASFTSPGGYVLRLTSSDGVLNAADEVTVLVNPANQPPVVNAGGNQTITLPATAALNGTVTDDGAPPGTTGSSVSVSWSKASGPGVVIFGNASQATTTASFSASGMYVLRLTADDSEYDTSADVIITVHPEPALVNQPPAVNAGTNQTISLPTDTVTLNGTATDDGLPAGSTLTVHWTQIGGPDLVSFASANSAVTTARFSAPGRYVLRLSASDGEYLASADAAVIFTPENQAPMANAGTDQTILFSRAAQLDGAGGDDGLPAGSSLTTTWSTVSGPGTVTFGNPNVTVTGAQFSASGTYVLRLTASDGALSVSDDVTITVNDDVAPPTVEITAPADGSSITERSVVTGSVSSGAWQLEYSLASDDNTNNRIWSTFASGNGPVSSGSLGTLDPSMMLNGLFTIRLSATDSYGQVSRTSTSIIVERNLKIGNFNVSFTDLNIPVAGVPMEVTRTYDSRDKRIGDFGFGWMLSLKNIRLEKSGVLGFKWYQTVSQEVFPNYCLEATSSHVVTVTFPGGKVFKFQAAVTPQCQRFAPITSGTVSFAPMPGTHGTLEVVGSAEVQVEGSIPGPVNLIGFGGGIDIFNSFVFKFTAADGTAYVIDQRTGLQSVADTNNNTVTVSAGGIIHSSSGIQTNSITFTRDSLGRISQIIDPAGNAQTYAYDAHSDLISSTDNENNTSTYTYDATHRLLTIHDPRGTQPIRNDYDADGRLISHTDGFGKVITYTHDLPGRVETIMDRLGHSTSFEYDERGNVLTKTDARGGVTTFTYDANDNVLTETNALGKTTTYTYDAGDHRTSVTDPLGNVSQFTYNSLGEVLTTTDALNHTTTNTYNAAGNLLSSKDALNTTTSFTYSIFDGQRTSMTDALNNTSRYDYTGGYLTKETDALGHETTFSYDPNGNRTSQTVRRTNAQAQSESITTSYEYDKLNRLRKTIFADGSATQVDYNSIGQQSATMDQLGHRTEFTYDEMGRLTRTGYPDGTHEETTYDAEGHRLTSRDRADHVTSYAYDELGRLTKTTFADATFMRTAYDAAGRVLSTTDARGNTTSYEYDPNCGCSARRSRIIDALGHVTAFSYDGNGSEISMTDALGRTTTYEYDALNRRTRKTYPDGTFESVSYDALSHPVSKTDQAGKITQFFYDELGRLSKVKDALNQETTYGYNELGQRISQTDANNHATRFEYDQLGRRVKRVLPLGQFEAYSYDYTGNLQSKVDFNGNTTSFSYDELGRLLTKTPDPLLNQPVVSFSYNPNGQRATMNDASGLTVYNYDVRNQLASKQSPFGTLSYTYDDAGHLLTTRSSNVNGVSIDYSYNAVSQLTSVKDNNLLVLNGGVTSYSYDPAGNLQSTSYPNTVSTTYGYTTLNRLNAITVSTPVSALASYSYTLAAAGNRTSVTELDGRSVNYTYDDLYRLTNETITNDHSGINGTISYGQDPVGNRLTRNSSVAGIPSQISTYDANDRLMSESYDNNGNTTSANDNNYAYDFENHLSSLNDGSASYVYDGDGNRVANTVGGVTTNYLVDTSNLTGHAQVVEALQAGSVTRTFTYGHDLISQRIVGSSLSFYGYDGHGSVRLLTDASAGITDTYDYDAFGNLISRTGTTPNDYLYSGEQFDPNVGFYYLRARYMSPDTGRFQTMDDYDGQPFDQRSLHKYLYAGSDPINKADPSGKSFLVFESIGAATELGIRGSGGISGAAVLGWIKFLLIGIATTTITATTVEIAKRSQLPIRVNHYTTWSSLALISTSNSIANPNPGGRNYFTLDLYVFGEIARNRLATCKTMEVMVQLNVYLSADGIGPTTTVLPRRCLDGKLDPGGGQEMSTSQPVPFWTRQPLFYPLF